MDTQHPGPAYTGPFRGARPCPPAACLCAYACLPARLLSNEEGKGGHRGHQGPGVAQAWPHLHTLASPAPAACRLPFLTITPIQSPPLRASDSAENSPALASGSLCHQGALTHASHLKALAAPLSKVASWGTRPTRCSPRWKGSGARMSGEPWELCGPRCVAQALSSPSGTYVALFYSSGISQTPVTTASVFCMASTASPWDCAFGLGLKYQGRLRPYVAQ